MTAVPTERPPRMEPAEYSAGWRWVAVALFTGTVAQLLVGTFATALSQFAGKGFASRLIAYPVLMLLVPAGWALRQRSRGGPLPYPWPAFALIMAPFAIDVTGNTLNLYDTVNWWDDANHLVNWLLLCAGIGLLLQRAVRPPWVLGVLVCGIGALLAVAWELGEWYLFIRHGTELNTAYQDTLGDETLGILGAGIAGVLLARRSRHSATRSGRSAQRR